MESRIKTSNSASKHFVCTFGKFEFLCTNRRYCTASLWDFSRIAGVSMHVFVGRWIRRSRAIASSRGTTPIPQEQWSVSSWARSAQRCLYVGNEGFLVIICHIQVVLTDISKLRIGLDTNNNKKMIKNCH